MFVFGREGEHPHDYPAVFDEWLAGLTMSRAVARNLMHDHRVTRERAGFFDRFITRPCSCETFQRALLKYKERQVQHLSPPDFAVDTLNHGNVLSGTSDGAHVISKDLELANVLDLSLLTEPYAWAQKHIKAFEGYRDVSPDRLETWLDSKLRSAPPRRFIEDVFAMLTAYTAHKKPHHPTWVTTWDAFAPYVAQPPERWPQAVGVERPVGHWLIVLRYRVRDVGSLARPTQLDAGWYAYHFPSPPQAQASVGGHPVDLAHPGGAPLLPEFIHEQAAYTIEQWDAAGQHVGKIGHSRSWGVAQARRHHHRRLVAAYGVNVANWMPTAI